MTGINIIYIYLYNKILIVTEISIIKNNKRRCINQLELQIIPYSILSVKQSKYVAVLWPGYYRVLQICDR